MHRGEHKRRSSSLMLACAGIALVGCPESDPSPAGFVPHDYAERFEEVRDCRFSVEHDSVYIRILAAPEAAAAYRDGQYPFEVGTVIVKQEFRDASCTDVLGVTAMQRLATGEAPEHGDWSWERAGPNLTVVDGVDPAGCAACHQACTSGRDLTCADP
jgi:hypothetical protein